MSTSSVSTRRGRLSQAERAEKNRESLTRAVSGQSGMNGEAIVSDTVRHGKTGDFFIVVPGAITGRSYAEVDANAKLIAAAPDMLHAIYTALAWLGRDHKTADQQATAIKNAADVLRGAMEAVDNEPATV